MSKGNALTTVLCVVFTATVLLFLKVSLDVHSDKLFKQHPSKMTGQFVRNSVDSELISDLNARAHRLQENNVKPIAEIDTLKIGSEPKMSVYQSNPPLARNEAGGVKSAPALPLQFGSKSLYTKENNYKISPPIMNIIKELFELEKKDPQKLISILKHDDPLGVEVGPELFKCPAEVGSSRLTSDSMVDADRIRRFQEGDIDTWIFYQHLRKAGGTGFCQLATDNLGKHRVPSYYCMIDNRGSLATPPWNDPAYTTSQLKQRGYRITSNEWDVFYESMFEWPGALFATTIRDPIDRIYSQYRFEHLERRDGSSDEKRVSAREYYNSMKSWTMGANYYIKTFEGSPDSRIAEAGTSDFYWTYHKFNKRSISWEMFSKALRNIMRYHLIFVTEWLEPSSTVVLNKTIHWNIPPKQVLPHEVQAKREKKKSLHAEEAIPKEDYNYLLLENLLDLLYFKCVQRVYLERLKCDI